MKILKICLTDPSEARKGDAKLISERTRYLEKAGVVVDILYFEYSLMGSRRSIEERKKDSRKGRDIIVRLGLADICWNLVSRLGSFTDLPIQTWLSFAIARSTSGLVREISQHYDAVHIYHIRSVGIWKEISPGINTLYDVIDSYSLNLQCRLSVEKGFFWRALLNFEYKRITRLEGSLEEFVSDKRRATIVAVASEDLEYVVSAIAHKRVVPVGVNIERSSEAARGNFKELRCIFFWKPRL